MNTLSDKADPLVKGWCPGALRPMLSGDGLVVRVRPFLGRLRRAQADGLATLAAAHGNGLIDLSSRGNLQLRGVREDSFAPLLEGLRGLNLLDDTAEAESRRNILVMPFWQSGDETECLAAALTDALIHAEDLALPAKFGFAVDTGAAPLLQRDSADIRLERSTQGDLLLVADGGALAKSVDLQTAIPAAIALVHWFVQNRGDHTRMARLLGAGAALPEGFTRPRQTQTETPRPRLAPQGALTGVAFGQLSVETLSALAKQGALRMTPWRMVLIEQAQSLPEIDGLIGDAGDPLLRIIACTGAPRCPQAHFETRALARDIAPHLDPHLHPGQSLHISGCAKGCAHPRSAALTITGTAQGLNLIHNGRASDAPAQTGLSPHSILKAI
ncbi:MAG: precorrin-3B synthase [Sulfitobacter sp.]|jgi:precorrin-3B synthase